MGDWITTGRDYAETHYSPLRQIDAANVKRLGLAWSLDMETKRGLEATPIVVNGVMYVTGELERGVRGGRGDGETAMAVGIRKFPAPGDSARVATW